jgi:hypothetical protein
VTSSLAFLLLQSLQGEKDRKTTPARVSVTIAEQFLKIKRTTTVLCTPHVNDT